jgi:hypothetical protein
MTGTGCRSHGCDVVSAVPGGLCGSWYASIFARHGQDISLPEGKRALKSEKAEDRTALLSVGAESWSYSSHLPKAPKVWYGMVDIEVASTRR